MNYADKKVLVLGLGESGLAMANWLQRCGAVVRVADTREAPARLSELPELCAFVAGPFAGDRFPPALLDGIDFVALSPGLSPLAELFDILPAAQAAGIPVWGEIELFAQALNYLRDTQAYQPKLIAITGTNGKTTVTSLVGLLCARAGFSVKVAGNISPAALDVLRQMLEQNSLPQVWVLELSSFQLHSTFSLQADAATVLNLTQDHLDWHGTMQAYASDKARIFGPQTVRVLNRDDALVMTMASTPASVSVSTPASTPALALAPALASNSATSPTAPTVLTFGIDEPQQAGAFGLQNERGVEWLVVAVAQEDGEKRRRRKGLAEPVMLELNRLMPVDALRIRGRHNAMNVLAALALCRAIDLPFAPLLYGVREYQGEPHRVEWLQNIAGVDFFDDSKGTNVGATVAALKGLGSAFSGSEQRIVLIAGGDGKGQDFTPLQAPVARYVRALCLIGRDGPQLHSVLQDTGVPVHDCTSMEHAVEQASQAAQPGDVVLLSPACASFDMFKNYAHRAEVFISAVREYALQCGEVA